MKQNVKPDRLFFYTAAGVEVEYEPISPIVLQESEAGLEAEYRGAGEPLDPPTYTTQLAGGGEQTFPHDETTLVTDEDKAAWAAYKTANAKLAAEQAQLRVDLVLSALKISLPPDGAWEKNYKKWHIKVPQDPDEKLNFYILREILKTPADIFEAMTQVIGASMRGTVSEAAITAAMATFRGDIQKAAREAGLEPPADQGNAGEQPGQPGELGTQPDIQRGAHSEGVGDDPQPVPRVITQR